MIGFQADKGNAHDQEALLERNNFSLRPLSTNGSLDTCRVLVVALQPAAVFLFALFVSGTESLRFGNESVVAILLAVGLFLMLALPGISLGVIVVGILATQTHSRVRWPAALYWTWWPFWKLALCVIAAMVGCSVGNGLWEDRFYEHARLGQLRAYSMIDAREVSGRRLQDAGVVTFNETAGVDRKKTGCLQNRELYCVAPIVQGGKVLNNNKGVPHGQYDLFMAGTDCCTCPGEFRCGDWSSPGVMGGMRVVDERSKFFMLAAEDFARTHNKVIGHPVFFEWVVDPLPVYKQLHDKGMDLLLIAAAAGPVGFFMVTWLLNGILWVLCYFKYAAPLEPPMPQPGMAKSLGKHLLPQMHKQHEDEQALQRGLHVPGAKYASF